MAGLNLKLCEEKLTQYLDAAEKVSRKQSYSLDGRTLTYANLSEIQNAIKFWDSQCKKYGRNPRGNIVARSLTISE